MSRRCLVARASPINNVPTCMPVSLGAVSSCKTKSSGPTDLPILGRMEVLVRRLPVFDRTEQLYGYELLLQRIGGNPSGAEPPPEQVVVDVFLGIGLDQVAPGHRAFITVDRDILLGDAVRLLPKDRVVLQLVGQ